MARGRHARRSALLTWLLPVEPPQPSWREVHAHSLVRLSEGVSALEQEVARLRATSERSTAAEVLAELRAERLERELAAARAEVTALRHDLDALREEVVWAFAAAEHRLPVEAPSVQRLALARDRRSLG